MSYHMSSKCLPEDSSCAASVMSLYLRCLAPSRTTVDICLTSCGAILSEQVVLFLEDILG